MNQSPPRTGPLHLLLLTLIVFQEYLQSGMVSFSASYIMGGIGAAPEEFSLAAACYAAVAVVMIFNHRWLVERLGYRVFLRWALLLFAAGALICASSDSVPQFIIGRMVQALGGSAFFTAGRVQVLHYSGKQRIQALVRFAFGIFLGSGLAPLLAATMVENASWRGVFVVMLPVILLVALLVERSVPAHEPIEHEQRSEVHPLGSLSLAGGIFLLQFVLERSQYDIFSNSVRLWLLAIPALTAIGWFIYHDAQRSTPLIPYRAFASPRYFSGLAVYFFCYLIAAIGAYMMPVFMVRGLGFAAQSTGWMLSLTSLFGLLTLLAHLQLLLRYPSIKKYLLFALATLFIYGWWMSGFSEETSQTQIIWPLLLNNGVFLAVAQATAAFGTFRDVDEKVFSHAYQLKNVLREVASSSGISIATVLLQMRSTLHYQRLAESTAALGPWYGTNGSGDPLGLLNSPSPSALTQLSSLISRQATLMACQDYFWGLCVVSLIAAAVVLVQRKFV